MKFQPRRGEEEECKVWRPPLQGIADQAHLAGACVAAPKPQAKGEVAQVARDGILQLQATVPREVQVRGKAIFWKGRQRNLLPDLQNRGCPSVRQLRQPHLPLLLLLFPLPDLKKEEEGAEEVV